LSNNPVESMILILTCGPVMGLVVGVIYFVKSNRNAVLWVRLLSSAFGPSLVLLFVVAGIGWPDRYRYNATGVQAYYWLQVVPLLLLIFSLAKYPGNRRLHLLLVPVGLVAWVGTFAWGWLFVHGE
jgi:hypothetical protein